jgi:lipid A ethanolaminephosphotransferase
MFYMSDHGESLGEQGLYLHGLPYAIAPNEQKHIPFLAWISPAFSESTGLDIACIKSQADNRYSHDNFFHTTLGLLGVQTTLYQPKLDVFNPCRHNR